MWPSAENPDLGSFLVPLTRGLEALGHEVEVASISRRGGTYGKVVRIKANEEDAEQEGREAKAHGRANHPLDELLGKEDDESQAETSHDEGYDDIQGDPSLSTPTSPWGEQ